MSNETQSAYITLSEAAKRLPGKPDPSTLFRWSRSGVLAADGQRVRLPLLRVGRRLFVAPAELDIFVERLTAADDTQYRPRASKRAAERAEAAATLDAAGI